MKEDTKIGKIYKQHYTSSWKGWGFGAQMEELQASAIEARVAVACGDYSKLPYYVGILGAIVNELRMPTTNADAKDDMRMEYDKLKMAVRDENLKIKNGIKETFDYSLVDTTEKFHDWVIDHMQCIGQGIPLSKDIISKKEAKAGLIKK